MEEVIYLDTNVFLTATLQTEKAGEEAIAILREVQTGKLMAATSVLTYDEFYWSTKKHRGKDDALLAAKAILAIHNLRFIDVTMEIIWQAHGLLEEYSLDPRDAIHAACTISKKIKTMVSEDSDFDRINDIKRISIKDYNIKRHLKSGQEQADTPY